MKILILCLFSVFAGGVAGGALHWPGAAVALSSPLVNTVFPGVTKAFGYSTTHYINTLPVGYSPQYAFQIPQPSGISALHASFVPLPGASYYPASVFYPTIGSVSPIVPGAPAIPSGPPTAPSGPPAPGQPAPPQEQPAGDSDTAVIEAADFTPQTQQQPQPQETPVKAPTQPQTVPIPPASTFPSFPPLPQIPQGTFPQLPQLPQGSDSIFPQIPQLPQGSNPIFPQIPQIPQGSLPSLPQFPLIPTNPPFSQSPTPSPPSSFPAADGGDKGLNDEDTVSVESA